MRENRQRNVVAFGAVLVWLGESVGVRLENPVALLVPPREGLAMTGADPREALLVAALLLAAAGTTRIAARKQRPRR